MHINNITYSLTQFAKCGGELFPYSKRNVRHVITIKSNVNA